MSPTPPQQVAGCRAPAAAQALSICPCGAAHTLAAPTWRVPVRRACCPSAELTAWWHGIATQPQKADWHIGGYKVVRPPARRNSWLSCGPRALPVCRLPRLQVCALCQQRPKHEWVLDAGPQLWRGSFSLSIACISDTAWGQHGKIKSRLFKGKVKGRRQRGHAAVMWSGLRALIALPQTRSRRSWILSRNHGGGSGRRRPEGGGRRGCGPQGAAFALFCASDNSAYDACCDGSAAPACQPHRPAPFSSAAFRDGRLEDAVACYTAALQEDGEHRAPTLCNRSLAALTLGERRRRRWRRQLACRLLS